MLETLKYDTLAEYFIKNDIVIGRDVIRVTPETTFNGIAQFRSELPQTMFFLNEPSPFVIHEQGIGVIGNPDTQEFFITLNREITNKLSDLVPYNLYHMSIEKLPMAFCYSAVEFTNSKLQKQWMRHRDYMKPDNVEKRKREEALDIERTEKRQQQVKAIKKKRILSTGIKDIIRTAGFVPNDYVEIKEGMIDLGPSLPGFHDEQTIRLPKEKEVSAKYYILSNDGGIYMIGNTDTNEAILTKDKELVEEFERNSFECIPNTGNPFYQPNHYGVKFKDAASQKKWGTHILRVKRQKSQIEKEIIEYARKEKLSFNNGEHRTYARQEIIDSRAQKRRLKRNITDRPARSLLIRLEQQRWENESQKQEQLQDPQGSTIVQPQPKRKPNFFARIFNRNRNGRN